MDEVSGGNYWASVPGELAARDGERPLQGNHVRSVRRDQGFGCYGQPAGLTATQYNRRSRLPRRGKGRCGAGHPAAPVPGKLPSGFRGHAFHGFSVPQPRSEGEDLALQQLPKSQGLLFDFQGSTCGAIPDRPRCIG